ncbi:hypothetical protein UFOVP1290_190 [uncultured Caudovirales phage]|uniref:Uncharacterized protein n=1 Tax=uncultured Caudovirales phage TaxID=2100421 RepID=A0A6J5RGI6_9CAUD|nr:hypothetical protein UFOVP1290_190 [uncultured Caudovirales phage]
MRSRFNFVWAWVCLWGLFVLCDIAIGGAIIYIVWHFVSKFW